MTKVALITAGGSGMGASTSADGAAGGAKQPKQKRGWEYQEFDPEAGLPTGAVHKPVHQWALQT